MTSVFDKFFSKLKAPPNLPQPEFPGVIGIGITSAAQEYAMFGFTLHPEEKKRQAWISARLWHNGPHGSCCKKCCQAGYVFALVRANRLDLLSEYPELIAVYEDLQRDGMVQSFAARR